MSYPTPRLRPLGVGDLLDETIRLYRRDFSLYVGISALLLAPLALLEFPLRLMVIGRSDPAASAGLTMVTSVVGGVAYLAISLATTCAVSERYLGRPITLGLAYRQGLRRLTSAFLLGIVVFLALTLMGITILGIPIAVYFGVAWSVSLQALLLEGLGIRAALGRSRKLVRGGWWRVVGIYILLGIIEVVIQTIFTWAAAVPTFFLLREPTGFAAALMLALSNLMGTLAQLLGGPIGACGAVLLYYDLRVRKEGFDLELMVQEIEGAPPAAPLPQ